MRVTEIYDYRDGVRISVNLYNAHLTAWVMHHNTHNGSDQCSYGTWNRGDSEGRRICTQRTWHKGTFLGQAACGHKQLPQPEVPIMVDGRIRKIVPQLGVHRQSIAKAVK